MFTKKLSAVAIIGVSMQISGCVTLANRSDVNRQIPAYFTDRNYVKASDDIDAYIGRFVYKGGDGSYYFENIPLIKNNAKPAIKAAPSAYYYSSVINNQYQGSATFPFVTGSIDDSFVKEYEIREVAQVRVPTDAEPKRNEAENAVKQSGIPSGVAVWWVASVQLLNVREKIASKLAGNADVVGSGFSVNGKAYDSNSQATWYPLVSLELRPVNAAAYQVIASLPPTTKPVASPPTGAAPGTSLLSRIPLQPPADMMILPDYEAVQPQDLRARAVLEHQPNGFIKVAPITRAKETPAPVRRKI